MASVLTPHLLTGFSLRAGLAEGDEGWSPALIGSLDWLRLVEFLPSVAPHPGCELGPDRGTRDGRVPVRSVTT